MPPTANRIYFILNAAFSIFFFASSIIITIYHLISVYRYIISQRKSIYSDPSLPFSYVMVLIAILSGLSLTLDSAIVSILCPYAQHYGPTLYSLFKTIVYLILGFRIYFSFKHSKYGYNKTKLMLWGALLTVWTMTNIILQNVTFDSYIEQEKGDTKCVVVPSIPYIISQALLDITSGIVNCVLFVKPILQLYKLSADSDDGDGILLKGIAYKQCILSIIAILSSIIAMIGIGAFNDIAAVFVSMDMLISTLCIILMYKWNQNIARKIFCCVPAIKNMQDENKKQVVSVETKGTEIAPPESTQHKSNGKSITVQMSET